MSRRRDVDEDFERTLPHNLEAERSVLGAILLHNDAYLEATKHIRPADFFRDAHRRIYSSIERILEKPGTAIDLVTLREDLGRTGDLDEVGGPAYISALVDGVPRSTNVGHYARIVKDKSLLRAMIFAANKLLTNAYAGEEDPRAILSLADQAIVELQHGASIGRMAATSRSSAALLDALEWRHNHRGQLSGVPTGFETLDNLTLGWQAGDMIVLAARPSIGKTSFVLNSAVAAARAGVRTAIFSMEMRRQQLEFRMLSSLSGVQLTSILSGWIAETSWGRISQALGELAELPICIDDAASRTVWDIRGECRRLKADGGLGLVVIDYVQLMAGSLDRRGANRNEELTDISRKLKVLADEIAAPIIVLSQLNRAAEGRSDPRPKLSDLRESGALEQDADIVAFLHRKHHREGGTTNLILEKQRNGATGTLNLSLERETTTFTDAGLAEEPAPLPPAEEKKQDDHDAKVRAIIRNRNKRR